MRFTITLAVETDDGPTGAIPITVIERAEDNLSIDDLGLRIEESKSVLAALQLAVVRTQALDWCRRQRPCPCCGIAKAAQGSSLHHGAYAVREDRGAQPEISGAAHASPCRVSRRRSRPRCPSG